MSAERAAVYLDVASAALMDARQELGDIGYQPVSKLAAEIRDIWDRLLRVEAELAE